MNFENWGGVKKCQNLTFNVNFLCQKSSEESFWFFFHWRISIKEHICCYWDFLIKSLFKAVYFLITTNQMFLVMKPNNQFDNGWVISAAFIVRILHTILNNLLFICFFWQKGHYQIENTLKYGSEEKGSSFCKCSILLGFIVSKKLRGLWFYLLIKVQNATSLVFLT